MKDTAWVAVGTLAAALVVLSGWLGLASADPAAGINAKVIWAHGGKAYVASAVALPIQTGDLLTFYDGKKVAAAGKVSDVLDGTLAIARLTSGSLDPSKKLDKLRIVSERPKLRPVDVLRIGIPARSTSLFACGTPSVRSPLPRAAFRGEAMSVRSFVLARDRSDPTTAQWPDTLLVRLFDEATDEEIGLMRGELDVAIFWPGELSTQMREDPKWKDFAYGARPRNVLSATLSRDAEGGFVAADTTALLTLNDEVFRGDLLPWDASAGHPLDVGDRAPGRGAAHRFEVDRSVPGWQTMERALRRGAPSSNSSSYAIQVALRGAAAMPPDPVGLTFAIRCPVVSAPSLRDYVHSLGPDAFAGMVDCAIARGGP
jgi:hypothetical protein